MDFEDDEEITLKVTKMKETSRLFRKGYVVLPFLSKREREILREDLEREIQNTWYEFPKELGKGKVTIETLRKNGPKFVCGGFGACANPSSFHMMTLRRLRIQLYHAMIPFWTNYYHEFVKSEKYPSWNFHYCVDRLMMRAIGDQASKESWHRDTPMSDMIYTGEGGDHIFGGWVNFNEDTQGFSCIKGAHKPGHNPRTSFAKETPTVEDLKRKKNVTIPPGHIIIFYENIIHEVVSRKRDFVVLRMFTGWRITRHEEPLMGREELHRIIYHQDIYPLKSGQIPPMWPKLYTVNFIPQLASWMEEMFGIKGGHKGEEAREFFNVKSASMKPLSHYTEKLYPEYTEFERYMLIPHKL